MKEYKRKFNESLYPGAFSDAELISKAITEAYNSAIDYSDSEEDALSKVAELIGDLIDDCLYDMVGPDRRKNQLFKSYLKRYI